MNIIHAKIALMSQRSITLAALQWFADVAREGSFAAVAKKYGVDPSIVSRTIAGLEHSLGFRLFDRTTRRLKLTEAGAVYLDHTSGPVGDIDAARAQARDMLTKPSGLIRITASTAFGVHWVTPRIGRFMDRFPDISVEAIFTDSVIDIPAERIDLALRLAVRPEGDLIATKLMHTRYRVVASPDYERRAGPLAQPDQIGARNCLLLTLPGYRSRWSFRRAGDVVAVDVHGRLAMSSPAAIRSAALDGLGPALLANWMIEEDLRSGKLVDLLPEWEATAADFNTAAWLLYPSRDYLPLKVRVLIDYLKAAANGEG